MPNYTLEIEAFGVFATNTPTLEIWEDGVLHSSHPILANGSSISVSINYPGTVPTSLALTFNDGFAPAGRTIEIQSVKINDKYVNVGNYLSSDSLSHGASANVDIANSGFFYDSSEPSAGTFAPVTTPLTAGNDTFRRYDGSDYTLDGLAGRDNIYLGAGNDTVTGGAGNDMLRGGAGNDLLYGAGDNDRLYGEDGDDLLYGGSGNDRLYGGADNDELHGNDGDDRLFGHDGDDVITGGIGNDVIVGGNGTNYMFGEEGDDQIIGGTGDDTLDGGDDNDLLYGGGGADILEGGDGNDTLVGDDGDDRLDGNDGDDILNGRADDDELNGNDGDDILTGEDGIDTLNGDADNDVLIGGDGADTLNGGTGNDTLHGSGLTVTEIRTILNANPGVVFNAETNSFYQYVTSNVTQTAALAAAQGTNLSGLAGHLVNITSQVENDYIGTLVTADTWIGASDENGEGTWQWQGGAEAGINFWNGTAGGSAPSSMYESWNGGEPNDFSSGEDYAEFINGSELWNDNGGPSNSATTNHYVIEWDAGLISDDLAVDTLNGGDGDDFLYGYGGNDVLDGGADDDVVMGHTGNDTIDGGSGDDALYGGTGNDTITGGAGADRLHGDDLDIVIGQAGQVTTNQTGSGQWHTVTFDAFIENPVIKMAMNTENDTDPITLRVRNVTGTGFEWQIDEWDYLDGVHGSETVSWLAIAEGTHTLDDGTVIQAGTASASQTSSGGPNTTVNFHSAFGSAPVVMTQVMTTNEASAVVVHNEQRTTTNFRIHLEEEEGAGNSHAAETVGWIAIDNGGSVANGLLVGETTNSVTHNTTTVNFGSSFASNTPVILIDTQTEDGGDPQVSRGSALTASSVSFSIEEEQAANAEVNHTTEIVGYFAMTAGIIYADGTDGTDSLSGEGGLDILYGGDGIDTFIFESATAFADVDVITDFRYFQGDILDISDIITGVFSGTITDYVQFTDTGTDMLVQVDANGLAGGSSFSTIAQLEGVHGLDETAVYNNGNIVV